MIVEGLEHYYRARAIERNEQPHRWNRGSSMGYCPRRLAYQKLGVKGDPLTPRRLSIFDDGNFYDAQLKKDLVSALGGRVIPITEFPSIVIESHEITRTPYFHIIEDTIGLGEIKSMSNFAFERALDGEIDVAYCCQAWTYTVGNNLNPIVFVCVRKETRHICEVIFDRNAKDIVVTRRYGGDPLELAREDPMLIAEIRSPFDESVEQRVRSTIKAVLGATISDLPAGVRAVEPETVSVQGKAKAEEAAKLYGPGVQSGSWWKFETGRQIAGFPCSYCPFVRRGHGCLDADLEIKDRKPIWVIPSKAKEEAEAA